jgi:hypothetical protein
MRIAGCSSALSLVVVAALYAAACGGSNNNSGFGGPDGGGGGDDAPATDDGPAFGDSGNFGDAVTGEGGPVGDPVTCAQAAAAHSYIGCDYWPTTVANSVWSIFDFAVVVANTLPTAASVTVTGPNNFSQTAMVQPNQLTKIYLPWVASLKGPDADNCSGAQPFSASITQTGGAYHLVSTVPVTVYQFNALEYKGQGGPPGKDWSSCPGDQVCSDPNSPNFGSTSGCFSFTNDASLLLPSTAMTGNYRILGIHSLGGFQGQEGLGAYFAVTGTQNGTSVSVTLSSTAKVNAGGAVTAGGPGATITFSLNAGDVAEVVADALTGQEDLSGSLLKATQPVQVIAGLPCLSVPDPTMDTCDHVEESVFPVETLGKHYVVTVPTSPGAAVVGHLVRIYGNIDGTHLTYAPGTPSGCPPTINAGQVVECGIVTQNFEVTGDHEFAVGSFMESAQVVDPNDNPQKGDPSMTFSTAVEQYRSKYIFLAPSDYDENYADIVVPPGATLTLDGAPVSASPTTIDANFSVVRIPLQVGSANGAHVLSATKPVGIQVLGYGAYTSYDYPGGLDLTLIAPPPPK